MLGQPLAGLPPRRVRSRNAPAPPIAQQLEIPQHCIEKISAGSRPSACLREFGRKSSRVTIANGGETGRAWVAMLASGPNSTTEYARPPVAGSNLAARLDSRAAQGASVDAF